MNEEIKQAEQEAERLFRRYELMAVFLPYLLKKKLQHALIKDLNAIVNRYTEKKVFLYTWENVFKKERQGIAEDKLSNIKRVIRTTLHRRHNEQLNQEWAQNPRIIGRRIQLSKTGKNHCEICKNMVGVYPISFEWTGFHPNCQCFQTPVYGTPGKTIKYPNRSKKFVELNKHRFKNWKTQPDWLEYF